MKRRRHHFRESRARRPALVAASSRPAAAIMTIGSVGSCAELPAHHARGVLYERTLKSISGPRSIRL